MFKDNYDIVHLVIFSFWLFYGNIYFFIVRFSTGKPTIGDVILWFLLNALIAHGGIYLEGYFNELTLDIEKFSVGESSGNESSSGSVSPLGGSSNEGSHSGSDGNIPEDETPIPSHFSPWTSSDSDSSGSSSSGSSSSNGSLPRSEGSMNLRADAGISSIPQSDSSNFPTSNTEKIELLPASKSDNYFNK